MDRDFLAETFYCLAMLDELINQDYHTGDCYQLRDKILPFVAGHEDDKMVATQTDLQDISTEGELGAPEKAGSFDSETSFTPRA